MDNEIGFIVLRYVNSSLTNKYWIACVQSIRQFYPENKIIIIDNNSLPEYLTEETFYKTSVLKSEFHNRGELLPYYYFLYCKFFDTAVILHDSVIMNQHLDFNVETYKFLWEFEHDWDQIEDETRMINVFNDFELTAFYENKELWKGCFGSMTIITHDFLAHIHLKYDLRKLLDCILNRYNRCSFERVIACLLQKEGKKETLLGNIHDYCSFGLKYHEIDEWKHLPLIKHWTGR